MTEVFISYARVDQEFARDLNTALQNAQRETWIDWRSIPDPAKWRAEIFAAIEAADNFVFIISADSLRSQMCGQEVAHAVAGKKRIVTILYRPVDHEELLPGLKEIQWINYPVLGMGRTFQRLITAIDTDLEWVRQHTRFGLRAARWESHSRDNGSLLHGTELREAVRWLEQASTIKTRQPTELHEQYIHASVYWEAGELERAQRHTQRLRRLYLAVGGLLALAGAAAVGAYWQRTLARELVSASTASQDTDPELSLLIAAESVAVTWPWGHTVLEDAEEQLRRTILASHAKLTLRGYEGSVNYVAWSPDGKRLVTASDPNAAKIWDAASGREGLVFPGNTSVAWSRDGKRLVTTSRDVTATVWDTVSIQEVLTLRGHTGPVDSVAWSPDGKRLATASGDKTAKVWDVDGVQEVLILRGHRGSVNCVTWSPDGERLATASDDHTAKVWDGVSGKELQTLRGHMKEVNCVAWSPDGKHLATGSDDETVKIWDAASGKELLTLRGENYNAVRQKEEEKENEEWAKEDPKMSGLLGHQLPFPNYVNSVAWSPDSKLLATAGTDETVKIWGHSQWRGSADPFWR
ncbi:toll/interleukin-1 receptor domain-containing protein [Alloacidobacterium sp.]|uniref:toll/interleukin-1 receptor domain-containing protein n=1 Tax=Alloacidobacterium sp. TaxID=2951999 RepID=UPI002D3417CE|nr:TIR domain-containing protein [Alloacidobacterium sp.]HYK34719.1 TIR domain-containing protein [Alloacidobacterium sp.]